MRSLRRFLPLALSAAALWGCDDEGGASQDPLSLDQGAATDAAAADAAETDSAVDLGPMADLGAGGAGGEGGQGGAGGEGGQGGAGGGAPRAPNLRPTDEILERVAGGGSVDHVEDVDEGDENAFNSKRWVFASFFNRVKRQVAQNWDPAGVWRREDPDGSVYGFKSRETHVKVSLDSRGQLAKIVVVGASGVQALDDEAIRAFRASGPFPNPPAQLINSDGRISFTFGFFFEIGERRSTWKIYRSQ
ncbi:MAG: TonB family protein [Myxococcales bacterium]|nr:TonB family protein [Myxococcales bacterium]